MNELSLSQPTTGTQNLPLAQAVAVHLTPTGTPCSEPTLISLSACVAALLSNTLSEDVIMLSMRRARNMATQTGVTNEEFDRVQGLMMRAWKQSFNQNPLSCLFR